MHPGSRAANRQTRWEALWWRTRRVSSLTEDPFAPRTAAQTVAALSQAFGDLEPELAFEAVVDGRDAAVGVDAAGQRLVIMSIDGTHRAVDLSSGGTIQRVHRNSSIDASIETSGHQITLFDLVDWETAGLLIDVLHMRGFRSESPVMPPAARGRYPRVIATQRRGVTVENSPDGRISR